MKKILLSIVLGATILTSGAVMASPKFMMGHHNELVSQLDLTPEQQQKLAVLKQKKMKEKLNLTEEQSRQLGVIMAKAEQDRKSILKKYGLDEKKMVAMRSEMRDSHREMRKQISSLLSDEQKARMQHMRGGHKSKDVAIGG